MESMQSFIKKILVVFLSIGFLRYLGIAYLSQSQVLKLNGQT